MTRRLPIYLLIDTSESMRGAPLKVVLEALHGFLDDLRQEPYLLESAYLSIIAFGGKDQQLVAMTDLASFRMPILEVGGECTPGATLDMLLSCAERELISHTPLRQGDFKPFILLMSYRYSDDVWAATLGKFKQKGWGFIFCVTGSNIYGQFSNHISEKVIYLDTCPSDVLAKCFSAHWAELIDGFLSTGSEPMMDCPPQPLISTPTETAIAGAVLEPKGNSARHTEKAVLADGREVEYVVDTNKPLCGGMTDFYFTPDQASFVCFFKDQGDPVNKSRIEKVFHRFNPSIDSQAGDYWKQLFNWPSAIITAPRFGVVVPVIPAHFFFKSGPWSGKEKDASWFVKKTAAGKPFINMIPQSERGTWLGFFQACLQLATAVWRLHSSGLAHSDLCARNVLFDPCTGQIIILGWDEIVVPGLSPPDVLGTKGYIAPEVFATMELRFNDPKRIHPSAATDLHALAVLIYQLLLLRHPLEGPKLNSAISAEEDDLLTYGAKALFVEHPTDRSNRPDCSRLGVSYETLGPHLVKLFNQAFVDGLHVPSLRPSADAWISALFKTLDLLHPCPNPSCAQKWFVLYDRKNIRCPFCGSKFSGQVFMIQLHRETSPGQWIQDGEVVFYDGSQLCQRHVYEDVVDNERLGFFDNQPVAEIKAYQGRWLLINRSIDGLYSPVGNVVPKGSAIELKHDITFRLSSKRYGRTVLITAI